MRFKFLLPGDFYRRLKNYNGNWRVIYIPLDSSVDAYAFTELYDYLEFKEFEATFGRLCEANSREWPDNEKFIWENRRTRKFKKMVPNSLPYP